MLICRAAKTKPSSHPTTRANPSLYDLAIQICFLECSLNITKEFNIAMCSRIKGSQTSPVYVAVMARYSIALQRMPDLLDIDFDPANFAYLAPRSACDSIEVSFLCFCSQNFGIFVSESLGQSTSRLSPITGYSVAAVVTLDYPLPFHTCVYIWPARESRKIFKRENRA